MGLAYYDGEAAVPVFAADVIYDIRDFLFFFFSSRRRHTRLVSDWSSDVCFSDLGRNLIPPSAMPFKTGLVFTYDCGDFARGMEMALSLADHAGFAKRRAQARERGKLRGLGVANAKIGRASCRERG